MEGTWTTTLRAPSRVNRLSLEQYRIRALAIKCEAEWRYLTQADDPMTALGEGRSLESQSGVRTSRIHEKGYSEFLGQCDSLTECIVRPRLGRKGAT